MKNITLTILLFSLFSIFLQAQEYNISSIDSILKVDANSIVRKDIMEVTVKSVNEVNVKSVIAVTILNKWGKDHINLSMYYSPEIKINNLSAIIYDKSGNEIKKIRESKFEDYAAGSGYLTLAQDGRYKAYNYENSNYPYTIELTEEYTTSNSCFLPKFYFLGGYRQSVEQSEFIFNNPTNIPFNYKEYNFNDEDIEAIEKSDTKLHYKAKNIIQKKREKLAPKNNSILPYIFIALENFTLVNVQGKAKDWKNMGLWQNENLLKGRRDLSSETINEISQLVSNATTNKEKAKLIYEYVQNKTRYISIQLGIGGWVPILASEVNRLGYGDCKALTNYTKALLDSQGIPAYYSVIYAGDNIKNYNEDLVCMQGNHVLLNLPDEKDGDTWLECTSQSVPFGYISGFTDNRTALVITSEGGKIKKTKKYTVEESKISTNVNFSINGDNNLIGNFKRVSKGYTYRWYLRAQKTEDKQAYYKESFSHLNNLKISEPTFEDNKNKIYFKEQFNFGLSSYGSKAGQKLIIKPIVFNREYYEKINAKKRTQPILIQRGYSYNDIYTIDLKDDYKIHSIPKNKNLESKFGKYNLDFTIVSENKIKVSRNLSVNDGEFPKEEIEAYNTFFKSIHKLDNTKIIITQ